MRATVHRMITMHARPDRRTVRQTDRPVCDDTSFDVWDVTILTPQRGMGEVEGGACMRRAEL